MDKQRFDEYRDAHPGWEQGTPFDIAREFWEAGRVEDPVPTAISEEQVNQIAQFLYEALPSSMLHISMTDKATLVGGLRSAFLRAGLGVGQALASTWTIAYLHQDCPRCEDCAERAIQHAVRNYLVSDQWAEIVQVPGSSEGSVGHRAVVERV